MSMSHSTPTIRPARLVSLKTSEKRETRSLASASCVVVSVGAYCTFKYRFDRLNGLTLWPALSKVVTEAEPRTKFEGAPVVLSLPVHVVNASSRPRVLPAKTVLGHVHSKPKLTGCDTYLLKDQYSDFLEGAFKFN